MIITTLQFPSIVQLIDFQLAVKGVEMQYDVKTLTVTGEFSEVDIELAKAGFRAILLHSANTE